VAGAETVEAPGRLHPALRMMPVPAGLGVNIHFYKGSDKDLEMMAQAGVGIVRMDVSWGGVEKKPGEYDFSQHDLLIEDLQQRGMRVIFIIDYGNNLYNKGLPPHTDEGRAACARFCGVLAKRYAGKKVIWELWNEPNIDQFWKPKPSVKDYMLWAKAVVPAIRQADPNACIIGPATSTIPIPYLEACFKDGLLTLVDGVSIHPYRSSQRGPETAIPEYKRLRSLVEQYKPAGKAIPILSGEWGYTTAHMPREQQGKFLPRQWLANMASGMPISIWYDWHDDGTDPRENEHNFGTVTHDYQPKPAYVAMKTLIEQLRGYQLVGRLAPTNGDDFVVGFRRGDEFKLAVWTTGKPHEVELGQGIKVASGVDHLGQPVQVQTGSRQQVTDGPRYLTLTSSLPH
jgi:hypothetical protein